MSNTTTETKKTIKSPKGLRGLRIELDKGEVFPDDPGQGTPAMVYQNIPLRGEASATYWCAMGEGELLAGPNTVSLTDEQVKWLGEQEDAVNEFLYPKENA